MSEYAGTCPICGDTCDQESLDKFERLQAELREAQGAAAEHKRIAFYIESCHKSAEADRDGFMLLCQELGAKNAELTAQVAGLSTLLNDVPAMMGHTAVDGSMCGVYQAEIKQSLSNLPAEAEKLMRLAKIAESSWLVWSNEHGAWWRPDRCGYSADIGSAGRYSLVEAISCCLTRSIENAMPPETIQIAPESVEAYRDLRGEGG